MGDVMVLLAGILGKLPVVPKGTTADKVKSCFRRSTLWLHVDIHKLSKNRGYTLQGKIVYNCKYS